MPNFFLYALNRKQIDEPRSAARIEKTATSTDSRRADRNARTPRELGGAGTRTVAGGSRRRPLRRRGRHEDGDDERGHRDRPERSPRRGHSSPRHVRRRREEEGTARPPRHAPAPTTHADASLSLSPPSALLLLRKSLGLRDVPAPLLNS